MFINELFEFCDLFSGCECTQLGHLLLEELALLLLFVEDLVDAPREPSEQGIDGVAALLVAQHVLLCESLVEQELVDCQSQVQLQLLGPHLDVVLEDLVRVEIGGVALTLERQVRESKRGKGLLVVVDLELQDVIHCIESKLHRRVISHRVKVGLLLVSQGSFIC